MSTKQNNNFSLTFAVNVDLNLSITGPAHSSMKSVFVDWALGGNDNAVFPKLAIYK